MGFLLPRIILVTKRHQNDSPSSPDGFAPPLRARNSASNPTRHHMRFTDTIKVSLKLQAERVGFEPTVQFYPDNTLAPCRFRPLSHLSFLLRSGEVSEQAPPRTTCLWHRSFPRMRSGFGETRSSSCFSHLSNIGYLITKAMVET